MCALRAWSTLHIRRRCTQLQSPDITVVVLYFVIRTPYSMYKGQVGTLVHNTQRQHKGMRKSVEQEFNNQPISLIDWNGIVRGENT